MSCLEPKPALLISDDTSSTGQRIKFLTGVKYNAYDLKRFKETFGDQFILIPCGHCVNCVEQRTKSWAVRCCLEASQYENNCFVTLTYNQANLPSKGLCKKDVQRFIKNLRNEFGSGIRYFGCGEYGSKGRAHYHLILFNFFPEDAKCIASNPYGGFYYSSKSLEKLWRTAKKLDDGKYHQLGFVSVGDVSYNSCAYVARYCLKKIGKELGIVNVNPEFSFMSRRPGIGEQYFKDHFKSLVSTDRIYGQFGDKKYVSSFRYFDKLIERVDPEKLEDLKGQRITAGVVSVASELISRNLSSLEQYLIDQKKVQDEKYSRLKRRLV